MGLYLLLGTVGLVSGFLSGLLGIGGGIIMAPLLLYGPPLLGFDPFPMRVVAGLTIVQGLLACVSGALAHRRFRFLSDRLALLMGSTIFITALAGGAASRYVSNELLLALFGALALTASILMIMPVEGESENPDINSMSFSRSRAVTAATGVGLLGGLVGQGGSFILIPLMTAYVQIPTRIAIGSNLAIVFLSSLAGTIGKAATGQIEWLLIIPIALTTIPGARLGSFVSRRTPVRGLRSLLAILITLAAVRIWWSVFGA